MPSVSRSNISHDGVGGFQSRTDGRCSCGCPLFEPRGKQRATSTTAAMTIARENPGWGLASILARISVMAAAVLGHGSGVESFVGGLLSARLTEVLSGGRSSGNVFQSVSRSTRSY